MAADPTHAHFGLRNEADLLKAATQAVPSEFPNPERLSCPDDTTLEAIAGRRLAISGIDDVVDHIATCSPCFATYNAYRQEYRGRYIRRRCTAGAAILVVVIAASYFGRRVLAPTPHPSGRISEVARLTEVLDFHNRTSERSEEAPVPRSDDSPHLRRSLLNLQIRLPLGTEDGQYSLQFSNGAGVIRAQTAGIVKWDGTTEILTGEVDLRSVEAGPFTLSIRKGVTPWHRYSVFLD